MTKEYSISDLAQEFDITTRTIRFYEAVSDFGHSIGTPALLIVALWFFGALIHVRWSAMGMWTAAAYSFSPMFKFPPTLSLYQSKR